MEIDSTDLYMVDLVGPRSVPIISSDIRQSLMKFLQDLESSLVLSPISELQKICLALQTSDFLLKAKNV